MRKQPLFVLYIYDMFASIVNVYNTVKDLANKDQRGFITPSTFNRFAQQAQLNVYNNLFRELEEYKRSSRQNINAARDKSRKKQIEEDLAYFSTKAVIGKTNGVFLKTDIDDLSRIISISTNGGVLMGNMTRTVIDICYDEDKIERILSSDLSAPSESHPVALISNDIEVFPSSINKILVRYYKIPQSRDANGTRAIGQPTLNTVSNTPDFNSSLHFELPEHYEAELTLEVAKMIGLNLRDGDIASYAMSEQQPKLNK